MKKYFIHIFFLIVISGLFIGCEKWTEQEKYKRPDWLPGKLYTTVLAQDNLEMFATCLQLTGLDTILDVSGSWSVFAPTNEAMQQFLAENQYANIADIPLEELEKITEFHVIQNPWSLEQLQNLSAFGWRNRNDGNTYSYAYKRQTILKNPIEKYWVKKEKKQEMILTDSTISDGYKKVFVQSRKNVPVFYDLYMAVNNITSEDFNFYFNRVYEQGNVYYAGAKIIRADIFAENGFLHVVDRVVNPMLNAEELLKTEKPDESYKLFLDMVYWYYPSFEANMTATNNQPAIRTGGLVDTLWDLKYTKLPFALHEERIGYEGPDANETWVRHNGMFVPTDEAFREFVDGSLTLKSGFPHWRDYQSLPQDIVEIIIAPHFKSNPIYPSTNHYNNIFRKTGKQQLNEADIIRKEFGSNCTFIGLSNYIPNRVFTSVTGPVFLRPSFSLFRQALQYARVHEVLANNNSEWCFFAIPDYALKADSSLILNWINKDRNIYNFKELNRSKLVVEDLSFGTVRNRLLDQVGTSIPNGSAKKEFIRNLRGRYIVWNNSNKTVRGNIPSTLGYNGNIPTTNNPVLLEEPIDNGETYHINYWFNFESNSMRTVLFQYSTFYNLINKAGLFHPGSFLYASENYTIFAPSDEALLNYQADKLSITELREFIKNHFVKGTLIFTDNKQPSGNYNTVNNLVLNIQTGPDFIEIQDKTSNPFIVIQENEHNTNLMVTEGTSVTAVVHGIDKVLQP